MKKSFILLFSLVITLYCFGQIAPVQNTLLWRISGNGLRQSSYLFGTIHLTDKRVFFIGDSVYAAMDKVEGLATEIDMEKMGREMVSYMIGEAAEVKKRKATRIKDGLERDTWLKYKNELAEKLGKEPDDITFSDLDDLSSAHKRNILKNGEMPTFLDAWLSAQARNMGKWTGGIEDISDQMNLLEDADSKIQEALMDEDHYSGGVSRLVDFYINQRLDSIAAMDAMLDDMIMVRRNIKMTHRIDSLSSKRSTLFAVGAAHLPGEKGLISLLRRKGFTVSPVYSSAKVDPAKRPVKTDARFWKTIQLADSAYTLSMPGLPEEVDIMKAYGMEMKMYFDLATLSLYFTGSVEMPPERAELGKDSLFRVMSEKMSNGAEILEDKAIKVAGVEGRQYRFRDDETTAVMQMFLPKMEMLVFNMVYSVVGIKEEPAAAETFFNTFVFNGKKRTKENGLTRFEVPGYYFSVELPLTLGKPEVSEEDERIETSWQKMHLPSQMIYGISCVRMKSGNFTSALVEEQVDNSKRHLLQSIEDGEVTDSAHGIKDGIKFHTYTIKGKLEGSMIEYAVLLSVREGLMYYLYTVFEPSENRRTAAYNYLNSFSPSPFSYAVPFKLSDPDQSFSLMAPFAMKADTLDSNALDPFLKRYSLYDSLSATSLIVDKQVMPDWFYYQSDTGFLRQRSATYYDDEDELINWRMEKNNGWASLSFSVRTPGQKPLKHIKIVLSGKDIYQLYGFFDSIHILPWEGILSTFRPNAKSSKPALYTIASTQKLKQAANTKDKDKLKVLKYWLHYWNISEQHLPSLMEMAITRLPDFDTSYYGNVNKNLLDRISVADKDRKMSSFIGQRYGSMPEKDKLIRPLLMAYLSEQKTKESVGIAKKCLLEHALLLAPFGYFAHGFYDSLALTAELFPEVLVKLEEPDMANFLVPLTVSLLDDTLLSVKQIESFQPVIIRLVDTYLSLDEQERSDRQFYASELMNLLRNFNTHESNSSLQKILASDNLALKNHAIVSLIKNGQQVSPGSINELLNDDLWFYPLYFGLKNLDKLSLIPPGSLSQEKLAKSRLLNYIIDEEEVEQPSLVLLESRIMQVGGEKKRIFLYKVSFSDFDESYLGVIGYFGMNEKSIEQDILLMGVNWDTALKEENLEDVLKEYLQGAAAEN